MTAHSFQASGYGTGQQKLDSCLTCGRSEAAHAEPEPKPNETALRIEWGGRVYEFDSAEAARTQGFQV